MSDCMDCDQCCEESAEDDDKSDDNSDRPAVSPFGDHVMDQQEEEPDHAEDVDQPPPALPEDLDGNWARPRRERIRALPKPVTPTKEQRERHKLTHIPYADWCKHCVACRGRNLPHRRVVPLPAESVVPVISMDLAHIKRHDEENTWPFIVARYHKTRITFCPPPTGKVNRGGRLLRLCC